MERSQNADYQKLVNFMRRIQLEKKEQNQDPLPESAKNLIPKLNPSKESCTLELPDGKVVELPLLDGSEGPQSIDGRGLYQKTGMFTYDPGFTSTASCVSSITYIDGEVGKLWYRGYSIDELAANCTFIETCFLL